MQNYITNLSPLLKLYMKTFIQIKWDTLDMQPYIEMAMLNYIMKFTSLDVYQHSSYFNSRVQDRSMWINGKTIKFYHENFAIKSIEIFCIISCGVCANLKFYNLEQYFYLNIAIRICNFIHKYFLSIRKFI